MTDGKQMARFFASACLCAAAAAQRSLARRYVSPLDTSPRGEWRSRRRLHAQHHTCASLLQRELGIEPGLAIQAVYRRLLDLEAPPIPVKLAATLPLIGRKREWSILQRAWRETAADRSHVVLITGAAGIGKTRLVEELLEWANRQGIATARAHCHSAELGLAYAPVTMWLLARPLPELDIIWLFEITRLLPELAIGRAELPRPEPLIKGWQRRAILIHDTFYDAAACFSLSERILTEIGAEVECIGLYASGRSVAPAKNRTDTDRSITPLTC